MTDSATAILDKIHGPNNAVSSSAGANSGQAVAHNPLPSMVRDLVVRARDARRPLVVQWKLNYKCLNNRDYVMGATAWDEPAAIPHVWPLIASSVAWMTDQRPEFEIMPTAEAFSDTWGWYDRLARELNVIIKTAWSTYMLDGEISKVLWDAYTYGVGYFKTQWEAPLADGLGDAVFRRVDPYTLYVDPYAKGMEDATYFVELRRMTIADADRAWPGAEALLWDRGTLDEMEDSPHRLDESVLPNSARPLLPGQLKGITGTAHHGQSVPLNVDGTTGRSTRGNRSDVDVITVAECYVRDHVTEKSEHDPDVVLVRDQWRCIVVSGDVVLMDRPCGGDDGVNAFGTHPYDRFVMFDTGEWYGPCMVEMLMPLQRMCNWLIGSIARSIYLMGDPQIIESPRSGSRNKRLTNRPGQRWESSPENVKWMDPPQPHPQMSVDLVAFIKGEMESIIGLSAMVRGFQPQGRNAQGVIESVQDAAFVRIRSSLRELERTLRSVGSKMAATIAEFYTEPRLVSLIGEDGQRTFLALNARHFYAVDIANPSDYIPLRFSLTADAGSGLPTSKQARAAESKHLYELGIIDGVEVLKAIGWPAWANVSQRVMETQAAAAAQAAAAGKA